MHSDYWIITQKSESIPDEMLAGKAGCLGLATDK